MLMYSSPAAATAAARNGWGSIGSRMSRITSHPARFRAARWASVGWPPVTTPGNGSQALATPAAASSSWLMGPGTRLGFLSSRIPHRRRRQNERPCMGGRVAAAVTVRGTAGPPGRPGGGRGTGAVQRLHPTPLSGGGRLRHVPAAPRASPLTVSITDLFVRLTHQRWTGTVGQFRVPFALESLLSSGMLETTERSRIVTAARRDIGAQLEWRIPDRLTLQGAVVNGEGPNRAVNPDNRMAYFARAVVTPVKGLDLGGAFAGYSDSAEVDGQVIYRTARGVVRAEYISDRNRRTDVHTVGWYALAGYIVAA